MTSRKKHSKLSLWYQHSLSIVILMFLVVWIVLYQTLEGTSRWRTFFGNAIADWLGALVILVVTKYLHERGSAESRPFEDVAKTPFTRFLVEHSLSLFLGAVVIANIVVWNRIDPKSPWGEVAGNTLSQFVQLFALALLTKKLFERNSKEP